MNDKKTAAGQAPGKVFGTEAAYLIGNLTLAFGTALMAKADFGVSMVVAPAYLLHLKVSQTASFFTFGMAEYCLQGLVIILMCLVIRRFKVSYLFSFVTAVFYGLLLDLFIVMIGPLPVNIPARLVYYFAGMFITGFGVACMFHTYISPGAYELFVREVSAHFNIPLTKFKTCYDCTSCLIAVIMSFAFFGFGHFEGVYWGTILCALVNGQIIGMFSRLLENRFVFRDRFSFRPFFER